MHFVYQYADGTFVGKQRFSYVKHHNGAYGAVSDIEDARVFQQRAAATTSRDSESALDGQSKKVTLTVDRE